MRVLRTLLLSVILLSLSTVDATAQKDEKWASLDKSPFDMAYYPAKAAWRNYLTGADRTMRPQMRITYSRPSKNNREIFGNLVPYGKEWRLGANEATELTLYNAVDIAGTTVNRGTYTLSAVPQSDHWIVNFSSERNIWGSENRDKEQTVAYIKVMTESMPEAREQLAMAFQRVDEESANLVIEWDKTRVNIPISMNPVMFEEVDVSPMDQIHYPENSAFKNYLKGEELENADPKVKVTYSRPQKKGRKIFGELLKYGEVWRIGANESTEITFYQNVTIQGNEVRRGSYNLYAVVNQDSWDIILNTDRPAWGPPNRDESKDVLTVTIPVTMDTEDLDVLNLKFEKKSDNEVALLIAWEKHRASLPIKF